jgi:hypothetical protein
MTGSSRRAATSLSLAIVIVLGAVRPVVAQTEGSVSVGIDYGVDIPMSDALEQKRAFGVSFRLPRPQGVSAAWDFGSLTADLQHAVRGTDLTIGEFSARPVLGGIAYSKRGSRVEVTAIMTGGISFSKLELSEAGRLGIRAASGVVDESATTKLVLAVQPKLTLWVDLNRWLAVGGNASYVWQRPKITLTNAAGTVEEFSVNADMVRLSVGLVVRAF